MYADQVLTKLEFLKPLANSGKIVRGQDVRSALSYVERGEAEAGIVYSTDATVASGIELGLPVRRSAARRDCLRVGADKSGARTPAAAKLFEFLKSPEADADYAKFGFGAPSLKRVHTMLTAAEWQAVRLTLLVASAAVAVSLPLAIAAGWLLAKRDFRGKFLLETPINLPLVLPPVVTGYLLLVAFGRQGCFGSFLENTLGIRFVFDWKGAALASAVVAFPLMVRPIRLAFSAIDDRLVQAARTLGASRGMRFARSCCRSHDPGFSAAASSHSVAAWASSARRS